MAESKYRIFDSFSKNLAHTNADYEGLYACPICLNRFERAHLESTELTVEHIVPKRLGGSMVTLTCRTCNNECGTSLDAHLVNKVLADEILSGKSLKPLNAEIKIGEGLTRGDLFIQQEEGKPHIRFVSKPNIVKPAELREGIKALGNSIDGIKLSGNLGYKEFNLHITLIKIAYLLLFSCLGYGYILSKPLKAIREQIRNPDKKIIKPTIMNLNIERRVGAEAVFVYYPERYRCFGATYTLSKLTKKTVMIILPGLNGPNSDTAELSKIYNGKHGSTKYKIIPYRPTLLESKGALYFPWALWKEVFDEDI